MPTASTSQPTRLQQILVAATSPLTSSVPVSELIANIATAFNNLASPDQEASVSQPASPVNPPSSPALATPLPQYQTIKPPLPHPDFNATGSDDSQVTLALNNAFIKDNVEDPDP